METKRSIKVSFAILLITMIFALMYGLTGFIRPDLIVKRSFQLYTDQSFANYQAESPRLANYILLLERMATGLGLVVALGGLIVLLTSFKKSARWAWFYILVCGILGWGNTLLANAAFNNPLLITVNIIGLVLLAIGLIIPAKDFLGKK